MRLWSIHPKYLDHKGIVAAWRESLLAKKALQRRKGGYAHHPQLERFRNQEEPIVSINSYILGILDESIRRGYSFDKRKTGRKFTNRKISITRGQIEYEFGHLKEKLIKRDPAKYRQLTGVRNPEAHPLFVVKRGPVEKWEKL